MMKTIREIWNDLYDISLENYKTEDETLRNFSMIIHILNLEYKRMSQYILELKYSIQTQAMELSKYKQRIETDTYTTNIRTPLKSLSENYNEFTPKKSYSNLNTSFNVSDNNILNDNITDCDVNVSKENDRSIFIDDSVEDFELAKSPTLNKNKRIPRTSAVKKDDFKSTSMLDTSNIIHKSKKYKQSKLNNISKFQSHSTSTNKTINKENSEDVTFFMPEEKFANDVTTKCNNENMLEILDATYKNKNNSYECIPANEENDCSNFIYKREAVRKKSERLKLAGWDCPDCEKYYLTFKNNLSDEELRKKMNLCSRHRNKFNPNINTPQGFWNPDFSPTQDSFVFNIE